MKTKKNSDIVLTAARSLPDQLIGIDLEGRYRIIERIGQGGSSNVYKGWHLYLGREIAIKVIHQHLSKDTASLKRLEQEAQLLSRMDSNRVVKVLDFGTSPVSYLVMEYFEGTQLNKKLMGRPLELYLAIELFLQLCDGLSAAHALGVVHRDLKPSNVMLTITDGQLNSKILDFGVAKIIEQSSDSEQITRTGEVLGSPAYMPPEQWNGQADHRSDIYALGCIMYEVLTGKPAFKAQYGTEYLHQHLSSEPAPISRIASELEIPNGLQAIIHKCLRKNPDDRYQTSAELRADIKKVRSGQIIKIESQTLRIKTTTIGTVLLSLLLVLAVAAYGQFINSGMAKISPEIPSPFVRVAPRQEPAIKVPAAALVSNSTVQLFKDGAFSFLDGTADGPRDIRFCGENGLRVHENGGDDTRLLDLGKIDFEKAEAEIPWHDMGEGGVWGTRLGYIPSYEGHVYAVHVKHDLSSDFWVKMQILEMKPGDWIKFRYQLLTNVPLPKSIDSGMRVESFRGWTSDTELKNGRMDPSQVLKDGKVRLQVLNCAGGGNPSQICMAGVTNGRVDMVSKSPLDMSVPLSRSAPATTYFKGGYIPAGKVWVVRKATYECSGNAEVYALVKGIPVVYMSGMKHAYRSIRAGEIVVHPGEENTVFVSISRGQGKCDVTLEGELMPDNDKRLDSVYDPHRELKKVWLEVDDRANAIRKKLTKGGKELNITGAVSRWYSQKELKLDSGEAYNNASFNFRLNSRDSDLTRNSYDIEFGNGENCLQSWGTEGSGIFDLGNIGFNDDPIKRLQAVVANEGPDSEHRYTTAIKDHVYLVHSPGGRSGSGSSSPANADLWVKLQVLEMESNKWIVYRWEKIESTAELRKASVNPSKLMKSGTVRLQMRVGAIGGNPCELRMTGKTNGRIRNVVSAPFAPTSVSNSHDDGQAFCQGGFVPEGKVWVIKEIRYSGSAKGDNNGHGEFKLEVGNQELVNSRDTNLPIQGDWHGQILIHPGQESTVCATISNSSHCDVTLSGEFLDDSGK